MVGVNNFGGALGAAPVPAKAAEGIGADEALSKAKVEFEEQSKASDARSQALQEALHALKGGMVAGSEAIARVAELEQDLAQKVNAAEEQRQASSSRIAELEAQLAAKIESEQSSNKDSLPGIADQKDGLGDFGLSVSGASPPGDHKDVTCLKPRQLCDQTEGERSTHRRTPEAVSCEDRSPRTRGLRSG